MRASAALLLALLAATPPCIAAGYWLPAGDTRLRDDVTLLVDEGVIAVPFTAWPIPAGDLRRALARIEEDDIHSLPLRLAVGRVRSRVAMDADDARWQLREAALTAGEAPLLRGYATPGRDELELRVVGGADTDRLGVTLAATAVADPQDDQSLRLDGSHLTLRLGNWLLAANTLDRWWGPGREGSLILSSNARPMPQLSIDRLESRPFSVPVLRWLGAWRFSAVLGLMDSDRPDVRSPLFMGMRASVHPAGILEFGLSRSAQFCGRERQCTARTFWNVLAGNDNAGLRVDPKDEPGNQMAGFDARLASPVRGLPVAAYAQLIGEDNSSSGIPERYLALFGVEGWWSLGHASLLRASLEYANTKCKWYEGAGSADCAYRQNIFTAGYRYRGRSLGHTQDADAESATLALRLRRPDDSQWSLRLQQARLDRLGQPDPDNPLTSGSSRLRLAELGWDGVLWRQDVGLLLGYERQTADAAGLGRRGAYGFLTWRRPL